MDESATKSAETTASRHEAIIDAYWEAYLDEGKAPASVFKLAKASGISEAEFYQHFASLQAVESATWTSLVDQTVAALNRDNEYADYPARQKLLAFFYTYFEHALAQRSRLLAAFPHFEIGPAPRSLKNFRSQFVDWIKPVMTQAIDSDEVADRKQLSDRYPELLFTQFWFLCDYNLKDESERFEDTDALIEKTTNTFFDAARNQFFDSAFDLVKFLARAHN